MSVEKKRKRMIQKVKQSANWNKKMYNIKFT